MKYAGIAIENADIANKSYQKKIIPLRNNNHNECSRCKCLICGEVLLSLTNIHAKRHGYDSKQQMINDRKVKWL